MPHPLTAPLTASQSYNQIYKALSNLAPATIWAKDTAPAQKWHMAAGLILEQQAPALIIAQNQLRAKEIYQDMYYYFRQNCHLYPSRDLLFYAADVKSVDITRQRLKVLDALHNYTAPPVVVLSAEALLDRMTPKATFHKYHMALAVGDICAPETIIAKLVHMGYDRRALVEAPGQFALRGGILDVYPAVGHFTRPKEDENIPLSDSHAVRIEFFDTDVDSIRIVDAHSQRSIENAHGFEIYPVRELVFGKTRLKQAIEKIKTAIQGQKAALPPKEAQVLEDSISFTISTWSEEYGAQADAFLPFFYEEETNILDYLPEETILFFDDPNPMAIQIENLQTEYAESIANRLENGRMLPQQADIMLPWDKVLNKTNPFHRVLFSSLTGKLTDFPKVQEVAVNARTLSPLRHKPSELVEDISQYLKNGYQIAIMAGSTRAAQQLAKSISDLDIPAYFAENFRENFATATLSTGIITVARGTLSAGFEYPDIKLAIITDKELFATDKKKRRKKVKDKNAEKISHFTDLKIGDYIVHDNHGIGIFQGIEQVTSDGISRDYLKLEYRDGGNIYVQTSQMELIQKYIGGKEKAKLSKLGGADWAKAKAKTRKTVEILATDLIELYAKRQAAQGFTYTTDTTWQQEFEGNFPYAETDAQLNAIEDVKGDMESKKVMDRLVCGDVGYGKTEIAIRAAFKAVQDGKQVAYLVPTTILAEQHYKNFAKRMKEYPITVERLSRFQTKKEQKQVLDKLEKGAVDIVIGTHRLLSKDVAFKDLGLVIVDEEQRFGVGHKEKLKQMCNNVDVLTLTATPIPRTLHFSLTGIRDMSILDEPPEERQPIQTYVMEQNPEFVRDAINRELARGGQVYYLHNRVRNISEEAAKVQKLVPHARVSYAHGQMSETELENIMHDFIEGDIDVLVCTTIIETGLDIQNANTMIIQNADYMGLSQLYQLRGRVGRSHRLAYAYLMYKRDKTLTETSEKRLQTIREFTEFGAGFKIAMRDLEIRGAGDLLGAKQHGEIDSVGYDMYCKLLAEAVANLKGETPKPTIEVAIELKVDAHIPPRLIPDEAQKLEIYKKISFIANQQDYYDMQEEIEDRFGNIPAPVKNLLDVALLKANARKLGVRK